MKSGVQILFKFKKKQETDKAKTKNQIIELLSNRIIIMGVLLTALFCVLIYRLFVLQIIQGDEHLANFNYKIRRRLRSVVQEEIYTIARERYWLIISWLIQ